MWEREREQTLVRGFDSKEISRVGALDDAVTNKVSDGVGDGLVPKPDLLSEGTEAKRGAGGSQCLDNALFRRRGGDERRGGGEGIISRGTLPPWGAKAKRKRLTRLLGAVLDREPNL